jgi:hypothetical protein
VPLLLLLAPEVGFCLLPGIVVGTQGRVDCVCCLGEAQQRCQFNNFTTGGTRGMRIVDCRRCLTDASPPPSRCSTSAWME